MTLGGVEIRDHARGSRWWAIAVPAVLVPLLLGFLQAGTATVMLSLPAAALAGWLGRGMKTVVPTNDPTVHARVWHRPVWLRVTAAVGVIVCAAAALALMLGDVASGYAPRGWAWLLSLIVWGPAVALSVLLLIKTRDAKRVQVAAQPRTEEEAIAARANAWHFQQAGLIVKSPAGNGCPSILDYGVDEIGNPYYVAAMIPGAQTLTDWQKKADRLAGAWNVAKVEVTDGGVNRVRVTVPLHKFTRTEPVPFRPVYNTRNPNGGRVEIPNVVDYLKALPMGEMATSRDPWTLSMVGPAGGLCVLIAGRPGAGKGGIQRDLLAHLAAHPHIDIAGIDVGKMGAEFADWAPRMSAVAKTPEEAEKLTDWFKADMQARLSAFPDYGTTNAWKPGKTGRVMLGPDHHVKVLIIDEVAELIGEEAAVTKDDAARVERIRANLASITRLGRAPGYLVILATQKPSADAIPTVILTNIGVRICGSVQASYAAVCSLGEIWRSETRPEFDPLTITLNEPGVAVVGDGQGGWLRVQASWIPDDQVEPITARTAHWGTPWPWQTARPAEAPAAAEHDQEQPAEPGPAGPSDAPPPYDFGEALRKRRAAEQLHDDEHQEQHAEEPTGTTQPRPEPGARGWWE